MKVFNVKGFLMIFAVALVGMSFVFSGCAETEDSSLMTMTGALGYDDDCYEECEAAGTPEEQCRRDCCAEDFPSCYERCFEVLGEDELCRLRCTRSEVERPEESAEQNEGDELSCIERCMGEGISLELCEERCALLEE